MTGRTRLLVDGVFFQRAQTGIARVWRSLLPRLAQRMDVILLDRGNSPHILNVETIPFPSYVSDAVAPTAAESIAIEALCRHYSAEVFASTYYSTSLQTPALQLVYDMIPEILGFDLSARDWQEKEAALLFGRKHVCISGSTRTDLLRLYPEIRPEQATVAHCGIERETFFPRGMGEVDEFRRRHDLAGAYLMLVGSRVQANGYKNGGHLFEALSGMARRDDLTILCVGGEMEVPTLRMGGRSIPVRRVELSDDDLARAYCGAEALVYPSLYEGFGMPVAEAMACGCPVITTRHASLSEVAGEAAIFVSGRDPVEMRAALTAIRDPVTRQSLAKSGIERARGFSWDAMADHIADGVEQLAREARDGRHAAFLSEWARLRRLQADVDF